MAVESAEDLPLAVSPHMTSKLHSADDLDDIKTLGFRGEALASIAEVSRVVIRTRTAVGTGSCLEVDGGLNRGVVPEGCGAGHQSRCISCFEDSSEASISQNASHGWSHASEAFVKRLLLIPRLHSHLHIIGGECMSCLR